MYLIIFDPGGKTSMKRRCTISNVLSDTPAGAGVVAAMGAVFSCSGVRIARGGRGDANLLAEVGAEVGDEGCWNLSANL